MRPQTVVKGTLSALRSASFFTATASTSGCERLLPANARLKNTAHNEQSPRTTPNLAARLSLLFLLLVYLVPAQAARSCVVLQYHHVSNDTPGITSVTPAQFNDHLDYLQTNHFNVMPLREVVTALTKGTGLPEKCVSLTVDDAYTSVYQNAYPGIKALGWPMTVFVSTAGVDAGIASFMSWEQMREMSQHGVVFENHGHGHIHLLRTIPDESMTAWRERILNDIQTAQQRITQEIGNAPRLFAHPYGEFNPEVIQLVKASGLTGFGQQSGPLWPRADFGALPRFPMNAQYASMPGFIIKVNSLPLPVVSAEPGDPLVPLQQWRPELKLTLEPGSYSKATLQCFTGGSNNVELTWSTDRPGLLSIKPNFDLKPGRSRTNCTMPANHTGRFRWYSHNWFVRNADGSWYQEY